MRRMLATDMCNTCSCFEGRGWGVTELGCGWGWTNGQTRGCIYGGLGDVEPGVDGLQVECTLTRYFSDGAGPLTGQAAIPPCTRVAEGYTGPGANDEACYFLRTGDVAGDPLDEVSAACIEERGELPAAEIELMLRPTFSWEGSDVVYECTPPDELCPGLPF